MYMWQTFYCVFKVFFFRFLFLVSQNNKCNIMVDWRSIYTLIFLIYTLSSLKLVDVASH